MSKKNPSFWVYSIVCLGVFFRFFEFEFLSLFFFKVSVDVVISDRFISVLMRGIICSFLFIHWCSQKNKSLNQGMPCISTRSWFAAACISDRLEPVWFFGGLYNLCHRLAVLALSARISQSDGSTCGGEECF